MLGKGTKIFSLKCHQHERELPTEGSYLLHWIRHPTRRVLDSKGFIPLMTPTQALISIQVMAEHSHNWDDEATTREQINNSPNNVDTKKPKENIRVIQASFKNYKGAHITIEYPFEKEDKAVEQSKYLRSLEETIIKFCENLISKQVADNEWIWKFIENTYSNIRALKTAIKNLKKIDQLTQTILTNTGEKVKERTTIGKDYVKEPVPRNLPAQFLGNPYRTRKTIYAIGIPEEIKEDEGDMNDSCDITVEDEERLRKILTSPIHALPYLKPIGQPYMPLGLDYNKEKVIKEEEQDYDIPLHEHVMQPLTPQTVRITPPDNDYVASATNPILNKHLNEFGEEFADNTWVSEKVDSSLYKEMELEVSLTRVRVVERMDDPNLTMEEYIRLEEEKAHKRGKVFNWQTATYGKIRVDDDLHNLSSVEAEFPAIVINDAVAP
ncbi:hypothetical protein Tco_0661886 [Tanacetum coccineum]